MQLYDNIIFFAKIWAWSFAINIVLYHLIYFNFKNKLNQTLIATMFVTSLMSFFVGPLICLLTSVFTVINLISGKITLNGFGSYLKSTYF
jgi:hypothetical protein